MSAIGTALGGAATTAATIRALLVIDTSGVRKDMKRGEDEVRSADGAAQQRRSRLLSDAAAAATLVRLAFRVAKKVVDEVSESVRRLSGMRGISDPVTQSFLRLEAATARLGDSFVLGTLKSQTVQAALEHVSEGMVALAKKATGLGGVIDKFAKDNAAAVSTFAGVLVGYYAYVRNWFTITHNTFKLVANGIAFVAGAVVEFMGKLASGLGTILDAIGLEKASAAIKGLASDWKNFGEALQGEAGKGASEALGEIAGSFEDIWKSGTKAAEAARKFLEGMTPKDTTTSGSLREPHQELQALHARFAGVVGSIGDAWQDGLDRMGSAFKDWAADARKTGVEGAEAVFVGTESLLRGFSTMGRQAEQAFGKSSAAARIFVKAQLAMQAILAGVEAFMAYGRGTKALAKGDGGSAALEFGAATTFGLAAGLAGAQFAGLVGGRGGGGRGGSNALEASTSAADTVDRAPVVVLLNVNGNVLSSEEYLKNEFVPRMRRLVEEQGVTFPASDLANNGRV